MRIYCETAAGCARIEEAMLAVMEVAVFWMVIMVVSVVVASAALKVYHRGNWPKEDSE